MRCDLRKSYSGRISPPGTCLSTSPLFRVFFIVFRSRPVARRALMIRMILPAVHKHHRKQALLRAKSRAEPIAPPSEEWRGSATRPAQGIAENGCRLFERNTMLRQIGCGFPRIPFKLQRHWLLYALHQLRRPGYCRGEPAASSSLLGAPCACGVPAGSPGHASVPRSPAAS